MKTAFPFEKGTSRKKNIKSSTEFIVILISFSLLLVPHHILPGWHRVLRDNPSYPVSHSPCPTWLIV